METKEIKKQTTIKSILDREDVKQKFEKMLGRKSQGFLASVLQIVSSNNLLAKADPLSVYSGAVMAATLDLPLNNNLGFAYLIPFNTKQPDGSTKVIATFIIGYKGFLQLAQRSGQFKTIAAVPIYENQLKDQNPLTGFTFDFTKKGEKVIGFAAYFELLNGFSKTLYWTKDEVAAHAKRHSKTYGKKGSAWDTDENSMACKTVLKALISKYAPLSIEVQGYSEVDDDVVTDINSKEEVFVDAEYIETESEKSELLKKIEQYNTAEDLEVLKMSIDSNIYQAEIDKIEAKIEEINTAKSKKK